MTYVSILTEKLIVFPMSQPSITITLKLFAAYQEAYGISQISRNFPPQTTVKAVLETLIGEHPELEQWRDVTRFGVNFQFVEGDVLLFDGDEVVFIPPVSGG
jgi:molybdopterin synthase sulfur carrier subunit